MRFTIIALILGIATCGAYAPTAAAPARVCTPQFTVCVVDEANTGIDSRWVARLLSSDWNAHVSVDCEAPDVFLTIVHLGYGRSEWHPRGWIYEVGGPIWLDARVLGWSNGVAYFRAALNHEVGHVFGMQHDDTASFMSSPGPSLPTLADWINLAEILCPP